MTNNINTSITLYENEFKAENNFKVKRIGGQRITMQYVLFEDFGAFYIRMYDKDNNHIGTISLNCTIDQVVEIMKSKVSSVVSKAKEKKLEDQIKKGRWVFFNDHSRVIMKKDHHQYDLEELIKLSKKKEVNNA
tara:strand:- start:1267 stop:1668 length:402 start_codon:yes stop_codon:yes gene_type:complete